MIEDDIAGNLEDVLQINIDCASRHASPFILQIFDIIQIAPQRRTVDQY